MKNNRWIVLVVIVAVMGIALVLFINSGAKSNDQPKVEFRSSDWKTQYLLNNKDPQGLYVLRELIIADGSFTQFNEYSNYKLLDSIVKLDSSMLMYVGQNFTLTDSEIDLVLKSVYKGNDFFLSSEDIPSYLFDRIFEEPGLQFIPIVKAPFKINGKSYDMYDVYENDTLTNLWTVFQKNQLTINRVNILTTIYEKPEFISIPYGTGQIFLHLNPLIFMNYQLLREEGSSYLEQVLSSLDQPHIQWLTFARFKPIAYDASDGETPPNANLLKELSKNPAFRWGFIFAVFGWILYLLFRSKRRHPIIPAIEDHKNSGYSYVDTLAGIFYNKSHSAKILKIMKQNFYRAVLEHFYIDLANHENQGIVASLSKKSNVPGDEIEELLRCLKITSSVSDTFLVKTYNLQRSFYFKSGIWGNTEKQKQENEAVRIYRKKGWGIGTILLGIYLILQGFYLLTVSFGGGVLLWPIGIVICVLGTRMLSLPAFEFRSDSIVIYHLIWKKRTILKENIKFIERNGNYLTIHLNNSKKLTFNFALLELNNTSIRSIQNRYKN